MIDDDAPIGLTEDDIVSQLWAGEQEAETFRSGELASRQAASLDFHDAQPFGDEQEGASQYIEPVVAEVVEDMTVAIMEAFVSGDDVVEFEAGDTQDPDSGERHAAQATALISYYFLKKANGERILNDWFQSGAVEIVGFVKVAKEDEYNRKRRKITVPEDALSQLGEDEAETVQNATDNGDGTWTLETVTDGRKTCFNVYAIPSEEMLFSPMLRSLDDKRYKAHVTFPSVSDLIAMGFDREQVESLPDDNGDSEFRDVRTAARWRDENMLTRNRRNETGNNRRVRLLEEYDYFDLDGSGITELCQAFRVGKTILMRNGELAFGPFDEQPFVEFCPYPRAHKLVGDGLAEKVMPDQRLESVITRQLLDGLYASNAPRLWLPSESITDDTIDDLLQVGPRVIVRGKGITPPQQISEPFDVSKGQAILADFRQRRQSRTGMLNLSKGMDKDALNDTMGGQARLMTAAEKKQKYVARNFANSVARMFMKLMRLMREHGEPVSIKVGGKYETVDPSQWPEEMDFSLKVGLGSNGKEQRLAHRITLAGMQSQAMEAGLPIVNAQNLYHSGVGLVRDMALGEPGDFWTNPEDAPEQAQKPDPDQMKAEADAALAQAKLEGEQQLSAARLSIMADEGQAKMQLARDKAEFEAGQAETRLAQEADLARQRMEIEAGMAMHKADLAERASLSTNRPGGSLAE